MTPEPALPRLFFVVVVLAVWGRRFWVGAGWGGGWGFCF